MGRVASLALLLAVIVASGFWLARDRAATDAPTQPSLAQVSNQTNEEPATADAAPEQSTDQAAASDEATQPGDEAPVVLPSGYEQVGYLTDAPVQSFDAPQQVLEDGLDYVAVLRTNRGDIAVDLFEDTAPTTVNNFVFLALNHFYDDVPFHRVLEGFMAQTGDPTGTGRGGPGYQFDDEIDPDLHFDSRGVLAMANAGKDANGAGTNGSQFFITFEPTPWLDGNHTIFGRVLSGDDVLDEITRVDPGTPSAVAYFDDTLESLRAQGVNLEGDATSTVADALEALLGTLPLAGQSFNINGFVGAVGQAGGQPAFGFFPIPDHLTTVVIAAKARD